MNRLFRKSGASAAAIMAALAAPALAGPPTLEFLFPAGARRGDSATVTVGGKFDAWPAQVWTDSPSIKAKPSKEKGTFTFEIDPAAPQGPHLVRLFDAGGASSPAVFMVGDVSERLEVEPNDEIAKAQRIESFPAIVNGRLEKRGDVDSYAVDLEAGQCISAALVGRRLGSPMDPLLHLQGPSGEDVAFAHDGLGLDPLLVYRAQRPGRHILRVSAFAYPPAADVNLTGAPADVYRLSVGDNPPIRFAMPAGVQRGAMKRVRLFDWNASRVTAPDFTAPLVSADEDVLRLPVNLAGETLRLPIGSGREWAEDELNGSSQALSPPFAVTGRIERSGEEDRYAFAAHKGEHLQISPEPIALASPMDLTWRLENEKGERLAGNENDNPAPPVSFTFDVPADGIYRLVIGDMERRGGAEFVYRVAVDPAVPMVAGTVDADQYVVNRGQQTVIKLNVARKNGHAGHLVAVATDLPAGVTATSASVPEKGGEVALTLSAAGDAPPAGQPCHVMLLGVDRKRPEAWVVTCNLQKGSGQEFIATIDLPWLTIPPNPPTTAPAPKP